MPWAEDVDCSQDCTAAKEFGATLASKHRLNHAEEVMMKEAPGEVVYLFLAGGSQKSLPGCRSFKPVLNVSRRFSLVTLSAGIASSFQLAGMVGVILPIWLSTQWMASLLEEMFGEGKSPLEEGEDGAEMELFNHTKIKAPVVVPLRAVLFHNASFKQRSSM